MSATEGFWPGDAPAQEEHVQEPEPAVPEPAQKPLHGARCDVV